LSPGPAQTARPVQVGLFKKPLLERTRSAATEKTNNEEQDNCANERRYQRADNAAAQMQAERSAKPSTYEGANNPDNDVDDDAEAATIDDAPRQGTSNASDN